MLTYAIIVCTALTGLAGPWPVALIGGLFLSLISIREQQKLKARFAAVNASDVLTMSALASLATGCMTATAAFALGRLVGLLWYAL